MQDLGPAEKEKSFLPDVILCKVQKEVGELVFQAGLNVTFGPIFALIFSLGITTNDPDHFNLV